MVSDCPIKRWDRQRIFIALEKKSAVWLDKLAGEADVSVALAARELKRLGWKKNHRGDYKRPTTPNESTPHG